MRKKLTTAGLVKKLDRLLSRFVRMNAADKGGTVECVTCGKLMHWKDAHAGHYVSRRHMSVRFDERNVNPQCCGCNTFNNGALDEYSKWIIENHGMSVMNDLLGLKHAIKKWTRGELEELIHQYEDRVKLLSERYE